jgi:hypothetical protein
MPDLVFASKGAAEVLRQQTLLNEKAAEMEQIYRDDARAARELEAAAGRIFKNTQNPAKQFNEEMGKLLGNFKQGKINAEQYEKGIARLQTTYQEANTISGKLKGTVANMFGPRQLDMLRNYALGLTGAGGLLSAIALVKSEYQATLDLINKAAGTQLDVGRARNVIIRNMLGESPQTIQGVLARNSRLSARLGLPESVTSVALADALSASGGRAGPAFSAVGLAGRYLADQPEAIGQFAGSLIDMSKATGSADPRVNFGLLAKIGQLSRIAKPAQIATNAPQALVGAVGFGATPQEAAALYAMLTQQTPDPEGRLAATGLINFSKSLKLTFPQALRDAAAGKDVARIGEQIRESELSLDDAREAAKQAREDRLHAKTPDARRRGDRRVADAEERLKELEDKDARLRAKQAAAQTTAASAGAIAGTFDQLTLGQRVQYLQDNPAIAQQFLATQGVSLGEAKTVVALRNLLLNKASPSATDYTTFLGQIPGNAGLSALAGDALTNFRLNQFEPLAATGRAIASTVEAARLAGPAMLSADMREQVLELLQRAGSTRIGARGRLLAQSLRDGSVGVSIDEARAVLAPLDERLAAGTTRTLSRMAPGGFGTMPGETISIPATVEDKQLAKLIGNLEKKLDEQVEQQKETNRKLSRQRGGIPTSNE